MSADLDFEFTELRPRSWADAFPWLPGAADPDGDSSWDQSIEAWWHESIDAVDAHTRLNRLSTISDLAMQRLTRWTVGQIFPGLEPNIDLLRLRRLPVRAVNALSRFGCERSGQLMAITVSDMLDWHQVGVGTVDAILQSLADISTTLSTPTVTAEGVVPDSPDGAIGQFDAVRLPAWLSAAVDDFTAISTWFATVGLPGQHLLSGPLPACAPDDIVKARHRLDSLCARDILSADELEVDIAELFEDALRMIDPRAAQILSDRLFADVQTTLDQLGQCHGVTRERVRQIEGKARGAMLTFISEEGPLADVAEATRKLIGTVRPLDDLLELIPALGREVKTVGQPAWRVLDRLDDAYEIEDGWCVVPTMTAAIAITQAHLQERADAYGVLRLDDLDLVRSSQQDRMQELTSAWLTHCGYIVDGHFVLTRTTSVNDYGAAILAIEGAPLSTQQILDRFVFERTAGSLRNALSIDPRVERVDRDRWALTEWGMERYAGIRSVIREVVARGGGRARLSDVVEYITARYSVTASSVAAYAGAAPFTTKDGIVQVADVDHGTRKSPERTRRIFRRPDAWAYRVQIATDHLRGSGSVAPMAIATILNLHPGETRQLDSALGPQAVAWTGLQPSFGTIRRFLMAEDIAADTDAFLVIHDNGTFTFEQMRELSGDPLDDALALAGLQTASDTETAVLALVRAIRLPDDSPVNSLIGGFRERGDDDIADLLLSARGYLETGYVPPDSKVSAEVDDILDLL